MIIVFITITSFSQYMCQKHVDNRHQKMDSEISKMIPYKLNHNALAMRPGTEQQNMWNICKSSIIEMNKMLAICMAYWNA